MSGDLLIGDVPFSHDPWVAKRERYDSMPYRRVGDSGLLLPAISLSLWYNLDFTADELAEIDRYATESGIDLWRESSEV